MHFDRQGNPISRDEAYEKLADMDYKRVAYTKLGPHVDVSTVWLCFNHQFGNGPPIIFETMVFGGQFDQDQWRYSTEAEALEGHKKVVEMLTGDMKVKTHDYTEQQDASQLCNRVWEPRSYP